MYKFVADHTNYPDLARENKIQGIVYISFVVEPDGSLTNLKIEKGIGAGCDEEAERVVKLMPNWNPGKQNNREVRVRVVLPMRFVVIP
jgi:protein TonB